MNIGSLDRTGTLRQPLPAPANEFGGPGQGQVWVEVATVPCKVEYKPGGEALQAQQLTATQRVVFTLRYWPGVLPTWQFEFEDRTFQITDVAEIGRRRGTVLTCYSHA